MPVNFNSNILEELPGDITALQRAFFYNDSLFETIRVFDGRIPLLEKHCARLFSGLDALGFELPGHWTTSFFYAEILKLHLSNARVRLSVWRSPGGLYKPNDSRPQYLITRAPLPSEQLEWQTPGLDVGLCETVRLPIDTYSNFKTLNAARYVAAGREAASRKLDDVIILNAHNRVCEATSSNVFWWRADTLYTIPLSEGCVAGVMRASLLEIAHTSGLAVQEKPATFAELLQAEEVFLTNAVSGIMPLCNLAGKKLFQFQTKKIFESLRLHLFANTHG